MDHYLFINEGVRTWVIAIAKVDDTALLSESRPLANREEKATIKNKSYIDVTLCESTVLDGSIYG